MPKDHEWLAYDRWAEEKGELDRSLWTLSWSHSDKEAVAWPDQAVTSYTLMSWVQILSYWDH